MERLKDVAEHAFARHETFHPRYGWFRKAVQAAERTKHEYDAFRAEDSTVELGVGKNMVKAIRFWGRAAKLLAEAPNNTHPRQPFTVPSLNGLAIFDEETGLDPYLELSGTLWVLHWWMLRPLTELPVWWLVFQRFGAVEFVEDDLVAFVLDEIDRAGWRRPNESSIRKDVSCLLRMYTVTSGGRESIDDLLDCPMRELGLIEPAWGEEHRYRFVLGPKQSLPDLILAYACLDWMARCNSGATITMGRLSTAVGGPGRAFRLSETALTDALNRAASAVKTISVSSSAGTAQLFCVGDLTKAAENALQAYYRSVGQKVGAKLILGNDPFFPAGIAAQLMKKPIKAKRKGNNPALPFNKEPATKRLGTTK